MRLTVRVKRRTGWGFGWLIVGVVIRGVEHARACRVPWLGD